MTERGSMTPELNCKRLAWSYYQNSVNRMARCSDFLQLKKNITSTFKRINLSKYVQTCHTCQTVQKRCKPCLFFGRTIKSLSMATLPSGTSIYLVHYLIYISRHHKFWAFRFFCQIIRANLLLPIFLQVFQKLLTILWLLCCCFFTQLIP